MKKLKVLLCDPRHSTVGSHSNYVPIGIGYIGSYIKEEIKEQGISIIKHGQSKLKQKQQEYPVTHQLIKDGRKNKVLSKKINTNIHVTMVHGGNDGSVPISFSRKVLLIFTSAKKKLVIIKKGDHSLSDKIPLKKIIKELNSIVVDVV